MSAAQHTPEPRNPWKTTEVRIAPSHVYLMALMLDDEYPYEPADHFEYAALKACISRGWVERGTVLRGNYLLTDEGRHVARVCRAAIAKAAGSAP